MYLIYVGIGLLLVIVLIGLLIRHVSNIFESFQTDIDNEVIQFDLSGIDLEKVSKQLPKLEVNTTDIDSRPVDDKSRLCDVLLSNITRHQTSRETYKSLGDWSNVQLTNKTIEPLREQMVTLGCQNNNTQNN